jgi:hypothetical protein
MARTPLIAATRDVLRVIRACIENLLWERERAGFDTQVVIRTQYYALGDLWLQDVPPFSESGHDVEPLRPPVDVVPLKHDLISNPTA